MAHWADGRWNTISGLVAQVVEGSRTHANSATNTELTFTPPTIEKYEPLTTAQLRQRRYRVRYHISTNTVGAGATTQSMVVKVLWTDPFGESQTHTSSDSVVNAPNSGSCNLQSAAGYTCGVCDVWMLPGTTLTVKTTAAQSGATPTTRGVADLNIVVEAL